jgi:hypothetical protein
VLVPYATAVVEPTFVDQEIEALLLVMPHDSRYEICGGGPVLAEALEPVVVCVLLIVVKV